MIKSKIINWCLYLSVSCIKYKSHKTHAAEAAANKTSLWILCTLSSLIFISPHRSTLPPEIFIFNRRLNLWKHPGSMHETAAQLRGDQRSSCSKCVFRPISWQVWWWDSLNRACCPGCDEIKRFTQSRRVRPHLPPESSQRSHGNQLKTREKTRKHFLNHFVFAGLNPKLLLSNNTLNYSKRKKSQILLTAPQTISVLLHQQRTSEFHELLTNRAVKQNLQ